MNMTTEKRLMREKVIIEAGDVGSGSLKPGNNPITLDKPGHLPRIPGTSGRQGVKR